MFLKKRTINNNEYYYLAKNIRINGKIKKIEKYLGAQRPTKAEMERFNVSVTNILSEKDVERIEEIRIGFNKNYKKLPKTIKDKFIKDFLVKFTYNTTVIEGSTLTLGQTKMILIDQIMPEGKTRREVREAENHVEAFNFMLGWNKDLSMEFILKLHSILMKDISEDAGKIRTQNVAIMGSYFKPLRHEKLDYELKAFFEWYEKAKVLHAFEMSCLVHIKFVTMHPFSDGNGRMSRLLQNFILKKHNYPMLDIRNEHREEYYEAEEQFQMHDKERPFVEFCLKQYIKGYEEDIK